MTTLINDIKYALRLLGRSPGYTAMTTLILGLGIGVTTMVFSIVNAVLIRPLSFPESNRLVQVQDGTFNEGILRRHRMAYFDFAFLQEHAHTLEHIATYETKQVDLTGRNEPRQVTLARVTPSFFACLQIQPELGRAFFDHDPNLSTPTVMLSHEVWKRTFGGDPDILNQTIQLDQRECLIVGIMPRSFDYPPLEGVEVWIDIDGLMTPSERENRDYRGYCHYPVIARLSQNIELNQAQLELDTLTARLVEEYPTGFFNKPILHVSGLLDHIVGETRLYLLLLLVIVGLLMFIVCSNVANLVLARATTRIREVSIRGALGATPYRIARQLLTENILLALLGGLAGLLLVIGGLDLIKSILADLVPRAREISWDGRVLAFTVALSMITGVAFSMAPSLYLRQRASVASLAGTGTRSSPRQRLSHGLIVLQFATALVLLIGAGLMMRTFIQLVRVDLGFNTQNLLSFKVRLPVTRYPESSDHVTFCQQALTKLRTLPQIEKIAMDSTMPFIESGNRTPVVPFESSIDIEDAAWPERHSVSSDYFKTMGIKVRAGRVFTEQDLIQGSRYVILNEQVANRYWPNQNPIGQVMIEGWYNNRGLQDKALEVIGVVGDTLSTGLADEYEPHAYFPYPIAANNDNNGNAQIVFAVRTASNPFDVMSQIRDVIKSLDPALPITDIDTFKHRISDTVGRRRFCAVMIGFCSTVAVTLVAFGTFAVIAYLIHRRSKEIAIRIALGARYGHTIVMVLRQGMAMALLGCMLGVPCALALTRYLKSYLYEISPLDPMTYVVVPVLLTAITPAGLLVPGSTSGEDRSDGGS